MHFRRQFMGQIAQGKLDLSQHLLRRQLQECFDHRLRFALGEQSDLRGELLVSSLASDFLRVGKGDRIHSCSAQGPLRKVNLLKQ